MAKDEAELLAAVLDGELPTSAVSPELARLADLAGLVHANTTVAAPTAAFTASLRDEVLQTFATSGPGAATATGSGPAATPVAQAAATAAGPAQAVAAAALAGTVLITSSFAAASTATVPGDLLYETKRTTEATQLLIAGDEREVELLLTFATRRLEEALELTDPAVVVGLLEESGAMVDDALVLASSLALELGDVVGEWLPTHTEALLRLSTSTGDTAVHETIDRMLAQTMWLSSSLGGTAPDGTDLTPPGSDDDGPATGDTPDDVTDTVDDVDDSTDGTDTGTGDTPEDVTDTVDDVTDTVDDTVDDVTDTVDDTVDDVTDTVDDVTDTVDDTVDDVGGTADELLNP